MPKLKRPDLKVLRDSKKAMTTWDREKKQRAEEKKEPLPTLPDKRADGCDADELSRERGEGWART
jgi:hypothetical protein